MCKYCHEKNNERKYYKCTDLSAEIWVQDNHLCIEAYNGKDDSIEEYIDISYCPWCGRNVEDKDNPIN